MKKSIIVIALLLSCIATFGQTYTREGKQFTVSNSIQQSTDEKTGFTLKVKDGTVYDIYITKSNACYTLRTSKKTGNQYKAYLPKEMSTQIAKELGREIKVEEKK